MADGEDVKQGTRIRSVSRAAELLLLVASLPEDERTVGRLATELRTSVPTTYHLLNTLVDAKLLSRDERRLYRLGLTIGVLSIAYAMQAAPPLEMVLPLKKIIDETGESAYLSAWRDGSPVVLAHLAGTHAVQVTDLRPGFHSAAHARASGKVLLAFTNDAERERYLIMNSLHRLTERTITDPKVLARELQCVTESGYATEEEEFSAGVACISVPVWSSGILIGAYTISAPVDRYRENRRRYLVCLQDAAELRDLFQA